MSSFPSHPNPESYDLRQPSLIFFDRQGRIYRADMIPHGDLSAADEWIGRNLSDQLIVEFRRENILPGLLARFSDPATVQVAVPKGAFIRTADRKALFFAEGYIARVDEDRFLFAFRNVVDEITQEYMLKMALSSTKIFPWYYDFVRGAMVIDARYYEYTGIPTEDNTMTLAEFGERIHPDDRALMAKAFEQQLSGIHYPYPVEFRLLRGDGTYEWFEGQSTYLGEVEGLPYRVVGICMSTQSYKNTQEVLTAAKNKAEQSDRLKSAFLANMSHEIRTPLNAIVGFSNLLAGGEVVGEEESREYAALISKNCDYLLTLVSDILDISRIETGTMEYNFAEHSLRNMLSELYLEKHGQIPERIRFNLKLPDEDIRLETDILRLRQVVDHLLGNAVKFTTEGDIELGWTLSEDRRHVRIFVADSGRGIPSELVDKIFERFYKVDSFVQGAGLGLSLCKILAENLGGTLSVCSRLGEGSRFTLLLPLRRQDRKDNLFNPAML